MTDKKNEYMPYNSENNHDIQLIKQETKAEYSSIQRKNLFFWMAEASETTLHEVMKHINPSPYKKLMGPAGARLHALLGAADHVRTVLERTVRKNPNRDVSRLEETHELHLAKAASPKTRRSPKREKMALHEGVIRQLFERGLSLRQVCAYLKRYVGLDVNHAYLRQCCLEMGIETGGKAAVDIDRDSPAGDSHEKDD